MLGALEAKLIRQIAAQHAGKWRPAHSAVLSFLLAHRNEGELCNPSRENIAACSGISLRTVTNVLNDLKGWEIVTWKSGGKRLRGQRFCNQYSLPLFTLINGRLASEQNLASASGQNWDLPVGNASGQNLASASGQRQWATPVGNLVAQEALEALEAKTEAFEARAKKPKTKISRANRETLRELNQGAADWWAFICERLQESDPKGQVMSRLAESELMELRAETVFLDSPYLDDLNWVVANYQTELVRFWNEWTETQVKRFAVCDEEVRRFA